MLIFRDMGKIKLMQLLPMEDLNCPKTIKENFDIDLQYYSIVDFEGFVQLIDEAFPDGIKVNVEKECPRILE